MKSVCPFSTTSIRSARKLPAFHSQSGQASVFLLVILGTFLLASVGFAVDLSSMWFHRQAAQSAADSACAAGAMDMLYLQNGTMTSSPGFIVGTSGAIRRRPLRSASMRDLMAILRPHLLPDGARAQPAARSR